MLRFHELRYKLSTYVTALLQFVPKIWELSDDINPSTSAWLAGKQPLNTFTLQPSWAEVDKINIVTEFPCFLGLTVYMYTYYIWMVLYIFVYTAVHPSLSVNRYICTACYVYKLELILYIL